VIVVSILLPHAKNKYITPSIVKPIAGSQNESLKGKWKVQNFVIIHG
jgi:hypothetical protein